MKQRKRVGRTGALTPWAYVFLLGMGMSAVSPAATQETSQKKETWPEAMLAARANFEGRAESAVKLGPWFTTGPLSAGGIGDSLFPEKDVSLKAKDDAGHPLWKRRPKWRDGEVHSLPGSGSVSTYLFRVLTATKAVPLEIELGSDDGLELFLEGQKVLSRDVARGASAGQDRVRLNLREGKNRLLLKIYNRGGGHGFYFSTQKDTVPTAWREISKRFPTIAQSWQRDLGRRYLSWFSGGSDSRLEQKAIRKVLRDVGRHSEKLERQLQLLRESRATANDPRWLVLYAESVDARERHLQAAEKLHAFKLGPLRRAIRDLTESFPTEYTRGSEYLKRLDAYEAALETSEDGDSNAPDDLLAGALTLQREALLANPLLDFDQLILVKRRADRLGLPQNWQGNCALPRHGYDNEISLLSPVSPKGELTTLYRSAKDGFVGDVDLDFDASRFLVSMPGSHDRWQIWEINAAGQDARQVTPGTHSDVDNYDACYLPDGRIIFASTRCFAGVPCVGGGNTVANLCIMNGDGSGIRQLCFDQDHNWCPTVLNNGRVLYSRWEYSDAPHYFTRLMFHMNPDGTNQIEYYASNSMWPNSTFYARPIPGHPTQVVAVISGHHGVPRMGELVIFDPALGRHQATGVVQRIPGHGEAVEPVIKDALVNSSWPRFLHPYPLSEKYFLVACQPTSKSLWGIYLVDIFDNMLLLKEEPGYALFEPIPFRETPRPPIIPDKIDPDSREAIVYLFDVYNGPGLRDVPRGTVKKLRIYEFHYAYPGMGGHIHVGIDGPWDVRRILGTVDVEEDGSAVFRVPANTPLAVQPLDEKGRALQIMRSWFTAMPGEKVSCVGCHESQNTAPPTRMAEAAKRQPASITPWYGPVRGFSFKREVQPVLDEYCVGCHNPERSELPDFTSKPKPGWRNFTPSYIALHPYVRRPGPESDYFMQQPLEYHASTSELVQMLEKGHYNVKMDDEAWDRLITWIDLNVPDHGTWHEHRRKRSSFEERRRAMLTAFANRPEDPETIVTTPSDSVQFVEPEPMVERTEVPKIQADGWPFDADEASRRQAAASVPLKVTVDLGEDQKLELALVPAGEFVMGDRESSTDNPVRASVEKPFYLGVYEVTNEQYALFAPEHDSAYISMTNKDHSHRGHAVNRPRQPVIRVTWNQATEFCEWLSRRTGKKFFLPDEVQWEWACRSGTESAFWYGDPDTDFSKFANLADAALARLAQRDSPKWHPRDDRSNDGAMVSTDVGRYQPNAWGLYDMLGNVAEWTRRANSTNELGQGSKPARGGSWYDRPKRARAGSRLGYPPWQRVFNVGFRVAMAAD